MYKNPVLNALTNEDGYLDRNKVMLSVPANVGSEYDDPEERYAEKEEFLLTSLSLQSLDQSFIIKYMDKMDLRDIFKFNKIPGHRMTLEVIDRIYKVVTSMGDVELLRWVLEKDYCGRIIDDIFTKFATSRPKNPEILEVLYDNVDKLGIHFLLTLIDDGHLNVLEVALRSQYVRTVDIVKYAGVHFSIDDLIQAFWNATGNDAHSDTFDLSNNAPGSLKFYEALKRLIK